MTDRASVSRRLATLPWPLMLLLVLGPGVAILVLLTYLYELGDVAVLAAFGVVYLLVAVVSVGVLQVRRRRLLAAGRFEAVLGAGEVFRTGRVPADPAVRAEVRRMLPTQRRTARLRWTGAALFGLLAITQATQAADDRPRLWVMAVLFGALAGAYPILFGRLARRLDLIENGLGSAA